MELRYRSQVTWEACPLGLHLGLALLMTDVLFASWCVHCCSLHEVNTPLLGTLPLPWCCTSPQSQNTEPSNHGPHLSVLALSLWAEANPSSSDKANTESGSIRDILKCGFERQWRGRTGRNKSEESDDLSGIKEVTQDESVQGSQ